MYHVLLKQFLRTWLSGIAQHAECTPNPLVSFMTGSQSVHCPYTDSFEDGEKHALRFPQGKLLKLPRH